jgi:hypothetical protein
MARAVDVGTFKATMNPGFVGTGAITPLEPVATLVAPASSVARRHPFSGR